MKFLVAIRSEVFKLWTSLVFSKSSLSQIWNYSVTFKKKPELDHKVTLAYMKTKKCSKTLLFLPYFSYRVEVWGNTYKEKRLGTTYYCEKRAGHIRLLKMTACSMCEILVVSCTVMWLKKNNDDSMKVYIEYRMYLWWIPAVCTAAGRRRWRPPTDQRTASESTLAEPTWTDCTRTHTQY